MSFTSAPAATRYIAFLLALFMVVALAPAQQAQADTGEDSPPVWWPLRGENSGGENLIGCAYLSPNASCITPAGTLYHGDWAIDIAADRGEPIYATGGGTVISAENDQGANCNYNTVRRPGDCPDGARGNHVLIDHGENEDGKRIYSFYTHFETVDVNEGDHVGPTTKLGGAGDSGWSTPGFVHLHYERRNASGATDPGPLKACVDGSVVTYPHALDGDYTSWEGLPGHTLAAESDGVDCAYPPGNGNGGGDGTALKVDVAFAIDTTGSMGPYIGAASAAAISIADTTYDRADARIGLVEYKDLYSSCPGDEFAARVVTPFTTDSSTFASGIDTLRATGGCDFPESVYSGIMTALEMPWRTDARKAAIVMGDARPHDPEQVTGYTAASVISAARDGGVPIITGSTTAETDTVRTASTTTDDTPSGVELYTVNIGGGGSPYFEQLAEGTGGKHYLASTPTEAVDQISAALTEITTATLAVELGGPYSGVVGDTVTFNADVTAGTADLYEWDFNGDGTYTASTSYPTATHTYDARFSGDVTLRATNTTTGQTASSTAAVTVVERLEVRYTGTKAGAPGVSLPAIAFVTGRDGQPVSGSTVTFTVGEQQCSAMTEANGKAMCRITLDGPAGEIPLIAYAEPVDGYGAAGAVETIRVAGSRGRGRG